MATGQLESKSYEELKTILTDLEAVVDQLKGNSKNFVTDQIDRHAKYGDRMFISSKQLDWLKNLHEEYVGTVLNAEGRARSGENEEERGERERDDDIDDEIPF
jgi:hypothetical protein